MCKYIYTNKIINDEKIVPHYVKLQTHYHFKIYFQKWNNIQEGSG